MNAPEDRKLSRGEARIRRAFVVSVVVIALAASAALILFWLRHPAEAPPKTEQAEVSAPAVPEPAPNQPPPVGFVVRLAS
jgi:multidrug resistance efflux pump